MEYYECSGFQRDLLAASAALTRQDKVPYGLAIRDWLDTQYGEPVNHSRLYQNLDTLVEGGLLERHAYDDRTNRYELTPAGRAALEAQAERLAWLVDEVQAADQPEDRDRERARADGGEEDG